MCNRMKVRCIIMGLFLYYNSGVFADCVDGTIGCSIFINCGDATPSQEVYAGSIKAARCANWLPPNCRFDCYNDATYNNKCREEASQIAKNFGIERLGIFAPESWRMTAYFDNCGAAKGYKCTDGMENVLPKLGLSDAQGKFCTPKHCREPGDC